MLGSSFPDAFDSPYCLALSFSQKSRERWQDPDAEECPEEDTASLSPGISQCSSLLGSGSPPTAAGCFPSQAAPFES